MAKVRARLRGDKEMLAKILEIKGKFPKRVGRAIYRRGEAVMRDSKQNYVPRDHGDLMRSGVVLPVEVKGVVQSVTLSFGSGVAGSYAITVHEHMSEHSPYSWKTAERSGHPVQFHPSGRGPKFLERPLFAAKKTMLRDLAEDLKL